MNCPFCNARIENENDIFCNSCGRNIKQAPAPAAEPLFTSNIPQSAPAPAPAKAPKAKSSNTVAICICAVIAVALICGTAVGITAIKQNGENNTTTTATTVTTTEPRPTEAPATVAPTTTARAYTEPAVSYQDDYIFPTHNTYLTYEILSHYTKDEIDLICNEMYARHGQIFKKEKNQRYFSAQSWYRGKYTSMDYVVTLFNKYEKKNLQTIADYRRYMGWS